MSKKGGNIGRPPKKDGVGRALLRRQHQLQQGGAASHVAKKAEEMTKLVSVLEQSSLDDFILTALMAQREFAAVKERDLILLDGATGGATTMGGPSRRRDGRAPNKIDFQQVKVRTHIEATEMILPPRFPPPPPGFD